MKTKAQRNRAKQRLARRRGYPTATKRVPYSLPMPVILPDWTDEGTLREYREVAERRERESRRSRIKNFLYHLLNG